ncbi:GIN domain-containing protein [Fretibacter rubidus]|uniref:GIN domain-containing protein n=1 Tax=Fretibacter rubidus TaxID=570162 RepID=UPI00352B4DC3
MTHTSLFKAALLGLSATALMGTTALAAGPTLEIENFVGQINVTQNNGDISVSGQDAGTLSTQGETTRIDGGQIINNTNCRNVNGKVSLSFGKGNWNWIKGGYKDLDEYPKLVISVPADTNFILRDSVIFGSLPDMGDMDVHLSSCGDLEAGDIRGDLSAKISGSGDLQIGDVAGLTDVKISGSGDFEAGDITDADISISGSGDANIGDIRFNTRDTAKIRVSGSGDIETGSLRGNADIRVTGSGDANIDDIDGDAAVESNGSGDITIEGVRGTTLSVRSNGSSDVEVDSGDVTTVMVSTNGSSAVDLNVRAVDATVQAGGSSNVYIKDASGQRDVSRRGSASVKIGKTRYKD